MATEVDTPADAPAAPAAVGEKAPVAGATPTPEETVPLAPASEPASEPSTTTLASAPTAAPTVDPADIPTAAPTVAPTDAPTDAPAAPTDTPTDTPADAPADAPNDTPTDAPIDVPNPAAHPEVVPDAELAAEETETGKRYTPFINAKPECKPPAEKPITSDQEAKYAQLLSYAQALESVPVSTEKGAESKPLDDEEKMWLTRECLFRYLRATKWNVANSKKRLEATLVWRREYGLREHTGDYISPEMETGKMYTLGFDNDARPCIYLNPGRQNTKKSPRQVHALVFMIEKVIDIMGPGQETLALLIDFKSANTSTSPSVGQGREVLGILQTHYPERLGKALVINMPFFIQTFFKIIHPFIDPLTREKLVFNGNLRNYVPPDQLDKKFGGDSDFEYENTKYWPEILRIAGERRAAYTVRWKELGSNVGTSEVLLRGGVSNVNGISEKVEKLAVD